MASRFQAVMLVASPLYPNAIAWSDENLIAVASGHIVTIVNPAMHFGPRGIITLPATEAFPIGVIKREDLHSGCMLPTSLSRDRRPYVRSVSWSPLGMASNSGCLLAVCTTEGRVKLYRPPFCDFCADWIEVMDISEKLFNYLLSINFEDLTPSPELSAVQATEHESAVDLPNLASRKERKRRRTDLSSTTNNASETRQDQLYPRNNEYFDAGSSPGIEVERVGSAKVVTLSKYKAKTRKKFPEKCTLPLIPADQYAFRSAMLSSLVVAWSPPLQLPSKTCTESLNGSSKCCSLLAVGTKSGKISFWRIHAPQCYSIEHSRLPTTATFVGFLHAHNSWVTAISWALLASDSSNPRIILSTGSSDGSVRIWQGHVQDLLESIEVKQAPFTLLKEVIPVNTSPVSVLSVTVPVHSVRMLLAAGKGSGSFEVWICDVSSSKFEKVGSYDTHENVVTGLSWAFNGCCLYSCSQDNFVRSWILQGTSLLEVPIPSQIPGLQGSKLPDSFHSCFGVAMSPGNLAVAMVRSFNIDLLHPMYQARAHKAAVEFFYVGGQQVNDLLNTSPESGIEAFPRLLEKEFVYWEANILWSLKQYENPDKPLVVWDIITALSAFKRSAPKYVERILVKWLLISYVGSHVGHSIGKVLSHVSKSISKITTRKLHLLNVICRRIILSELKADEINSEVQSVGLPSDSEEEKLTLWIELLLRSESELRERLVALTFSAFTSLMSRSVSSLSQLGYWYPVGLAQMERWVALNRDCIHDKLKVLASEVGTREERLKSSEYAADEQCSYCSEPVPFESPEVAFCQGVDGVGQNHKLARCAVSMQVCPITPTWLCICCHRRAAKLAPETLFAMPRYPLDLQYSRESYEEIFSKPLCPFCGILLQRLQPDFLLSAMPV